MNPKQQFKRFPLPGGSFVIVSPEHIQAISEYHTKNKCRVCVGGLWITLMVTIEDLLAQIGCEEVLQSKKAEPPKVDPKKNTGKGSDIDHL